MSETTEKTAFICHCYRCSIYLL